MSKIMLLDGNSLINRAFYAVPILTNKDGDYTNAVYGFLNIFFKLMDEESPDVVDVAFDLPSPTFRHEKFDQYKGTRKSMPEELRPQIPMLKSLLEKMDINIYEKAGFEADDILGTMAKRYEENGHDVVLVSGDKDLLQIASEKIKIKIPKTRAGKTEVEEYYASDVEASFGVTPQEFIDVKALMGDASDNVPGVPGIGEKTAFKIIQEYKTLENAMENADIIKPKRASENLVTFREQAILSKFLVTIDINVDIDADFKAECPQTNIYNDVAFKEFQRLEFKSYLPRFDKTVQEAENSSLDFKIVTDENECKEAISFFSKQKLVAYKIVFEEDEMLGLSLSCKEGQATYICGIEQKKLIEICREFFESDVKKLALDLKKDIVMLNKFGQEIKNVIFDAMIAGYILNASNDKYEYNDIAYGFLDENHPSQEEFFGKGKSKKGFEEFSQEELGEYFSRQSEIIFRTYPIMRIMIEENEQVELFYDIEMPLIYVLADMEICGIKIDKQALIEYGKNLDEKINDITGRIYELAEEEFNINSPKQMGIILFEKLGLKGGKKTKTGYSTAADVLEKLAGEHEIVALIMEYRTYAKLKSTYVDGLLSTIDEKTSKIYSTFNQAITTTGRISSTEPNLQNIPIRLELGRQLRKIFIPSDESYVFADSDYSQIELRVLAHISGDEVFIDAFKQGQDIHKITASQVFRIPFDEVTQNQRNNAKAVNFGIVYGIGAYSLSQDLGITVREAERYIEGYYDKYPKMRAYFDKTIEDATKNGYASTLFNRRRNIPELTSGAFMQRAFGKRIAMNMPIQGTAADIIKIAMVNVYKRLKEGKYKSRIILQVHDELLIEMKKDEADEVMKLLKEEMETAVTLKTPIKVDIKQGANWYEAH